MSKSLKNTVGILEEPEDIWQTVRLGVTDPARVKKTDPGTPEKCNIYALHQHMSPSRTVEEVAANCRSAAWGCMDCKRILAANIAQAFAPMRERARNLEEHPRSVEDALAEGAEKARVVAQETMTTVRDRMGLLRGPESA